MATTENKIFLCHASEDKKMVEDTYRRLKGDGFNPWLDAIGPVWIASLDKNEYIIIELVLYWS